MCDIRSSSFDVMTTWMMMMRLYVVAVLASVVVIAAETEYPPPSITISKVKGQDVILVCDRPNINVRNIGWHKEGQPVSTFGSRFFVFQDTGKLVIFVEDLSDEGNYTCYAAKGPKFEPYTIRLIVSVPPDVSVVSLNPVKPMEGGQIRIVCSAYGKPQPRFEWFSSRERRIWPEMSSSSSEQRMSIQDRDIDAMTVETSLLVSPVTHEDRGAFKCIAINKAGSSRKEISVDVQFAPKMLTSNETKHVHWWENKRVNLTCHATGNPAPSIVWSPSDVIIPVTSVTDGIIVTSTLGFFERPTFDFPASFECHAENRFGETDRRFFTIDQVYAPLSPQVSIISIEDDIVKLSITVPSKKATPTPTYITVEYQRQNSTRWITTGTVFEGNGTVLTLRGIILGHSYVIKVKVNNRVGYSNTSVLYVLAEMYPVVEESTSKPTTPIASRQKPGTEVEGRMSSDAKNSNDNNDDDADNKNADSGNGTNNNNNGSVGKMVDNEGKIASSYNNNGSIRPSVSCWCGLFVMTLCLLFPYKVLIS